MNVESLCLPTLHIQSLLSTNITSKQPFPIINWHLSFFFFWKEVCSLVNSHHWVTENMFSILKVFSLAYKLRIIFCFLIHFGRKITCITYLFHDYFWLHISLGLLVRKFILRGSIVMKLFWWLSPKNAMVVMLCLFTNKMKAI